MADSPLSLSERAGGEGDGKPLDLVLLGPAGAGKGTQSRRIADKYHVPHVASGDLLRMHRDRKTELGLSAMRYMDRGALVPDDLVISMIVDRMRQPDANHGILLDGFPRTVAQATALDGELEAEGRELKLALYLEVPFDVLVQRAAGRWTCRTCQTTYNYDVNPPRRPGICDVDAGELYQREDDRPEVVSERIRVYLEDTVPVVDYYRERGILREVDGTQDIETVAAEIERQLEAAVW
ncbi:MAG: adenylate kinase [Chloroflexi bacterium]|nr:adenylate kinase [Chloroflexota bacterium]MBV9599926.1 adenylate kinase [Chloroflexota bacterium]